MATEDKHNHHVIPRFYLKGFVEEVGKPFIWIYGKGRKYNPGRQYERYNPFKHSIGVATVDYDHYAEILGDGKVDSNKFENLLETLEKPADPIFNKLRAHQSITQEEKSIFSSYIVQMQRRVTNQEREIIAAMPKRIETYELTKEQLHQLKLADTAETKAYVRSVVEKLAQTEGFAKNTYLQTLALVRFSLIKKILEEMTWRFFIAPKGEAFLTGEDPVFFFKGIGLKHPYSEVSFPISSGVALVASWHQGRGKGFCNATSQQVKEINRRTASKANQQVFFCRNEEWVLRVLNKLKHRFTVIDYKGS